MFDRVAVIGDSDLVVPLRALGLKVYSPRSTEEAKQILNTLEQEHIGLCFLHERLFAHLAEEVEILSRKVKPVVIGFSDYRQITDHMTDKMREMAIKATGSDSLVKRRGNDEKR